MLNIKDECRRIKKQPKNFLYSGKYKDDREIFTLCEFIKLLEKANYNKPEYFKKYNPPEPDFHTFNKDKSFLNK